MFGIRKTEVSDFQIQNCQCGGINVCFGSVTVHMKRNEFMAMAEKVQKAKNFIASTIKPQIHEEHHEVH